MVVIEASPQSIGGRRVRPGPVGGHITKARAVQRSGRPSGGRSRTSRRSVGVAGDLRRMRFTEYDDSVRFDDRPRLRQRVRCELGAGQRTPTAARRHCSTIAGFCGGRESATLSPACRTSNSVQSSPIAAFMAGSACGAQQPGPASGPGARSRSGARTGPAGAGARGGARRDQARARGAEVRERDSCASRRPSSRSRPTRPRRCRRS